MQTRLRVSSYVSNHKLNTMDKLPTDLISEIDLFLGVKGRPYCRLVDGTTEQTECYQWTEAESMTEILTSVTPELGRLMAESQEGMIAIILAISDSDSMRRMRKYITSKAPHITEEYDQLVTRLEEAERRLLHPTGREPPSVPEEIRDIAERIFADASSGLQGNQFYSEAYVQRLQELWQQESEEVQGAQKRFQQEMEEYQASLDEAEELRGDRLSAVRNLLKGKPYTAYGDVIVSPSNDQFDILRVELTNGANYGLQTEDIIDALKSIDNQFGVDILNAGFDFVKIRLSKPPSNEEALELIDRLLELCPDLEGEDEVSIEGIVQLWWD